MHRTTYPDSRPGLPPLIFDDEVARERALKSLSEATACAEASLSIPEYLTTTQAQLAKLKVEQKMAEDAPTLAGLSTLIRSLAEFAVPAA